MSNELTITLKINAQGEAVIDQVTGKLKGVGQAGQKALGDVAQGAAQAKGQLDGMLSSLDSQAARWLSIAGATYVAYRAVSSWYSLISAGVSAVDDYKTAIYGAAGALANMTVASVPKDLAYTQWKDYFDWLWRTSGELDKHFAASGREIFETASEFAKRGAISQNKEEVAVLANVTDTILSLTKGMNRPIAQINQEIRALFEGRVAAGSQLALELLKLDANFKSNYQNAVRTNTVIAYLDSILPRISEKTKDISNTWDSVYASLTKVKGEVLREAFGPAYADIVAMGQEFIGQLYQQGELTEKGQNLAHALGEAWRAAKPKVEGLLGYIIEDTPGAIKAVTNLAAAVGTIAGAAASATTKVASLINTIKEAADHPAVRMLWGAAAGSRLGPAGAVAGGAAGLGSGIYEGIQKDAAKYRGEMEAEITLDRLRLRRFMAGPEFGASLGIERLPSLKDFSSPAPPTPGVRPPGMADKKGKSTEGALNAMQSLMDRLNQDIARLSEGGIAAIDAWAAKTRHEIEKLVAKGADGADALELLDRAAAAKKMKLWEEVSQHLGKESGNAYAAIEAESDKWLQKAGGNIDQIMALWNLKSRKEWEADVKSYSERLTLEKSFYDQAAQLTPVVSEQIEEKRKSLDLEIKLGNYAQATKLAQLQAAKQITAAEADQFRATQALLDQAKRYKFEMENDRGLAGWAYTRAGEASARDKESFKSLMGGAENYIQNAFSSGLDGVLSKDKAKIQNIGKTMWQAFIGESFKGGITRVFDLGAKLKTSASELWAPKAYSPADFGSGKGLDVGDKLSKAASDISTKFAANAAQFGLAAGGLLLSGIGIAANSQALVYAGAVLNLAGLAIQVYEALTATTTTVAMTGAAIALTGSAGALSGAAMMLMAAAAIDAIPFLHGGGMIAHQGLYIAHNGLAPDERLILAQLGEGIIKRPTMSAYARAGIGFDELNDESLPILNRRQRAEPLATPASGRAGGETYHHYYDNRTINPTFVISHKITHAEADDLWRNILKPAFKRDIGRY